MVFAFQRGEGTLTLTLPKASGDLIVDAGSREVLIRGEKIDPPLSRKEFDVLSMLYDRGGDACSRDEIAATGWPKRPEAAVADREIDQYIRRIRLRIEPDPSSQTPQAPGTWSPSDATATSCPSTSPKPPPIAPGPPPMRPGIPPSRRVPSNTPQQLPR